MGTNHVKGTDHGRVTLFTLSTCIWCKKTKALLKEIGVAYDFVDVDLLEGAEKESAMDELKKVNPRCSFPSLVLDDGTCIVGFDETKIRETLQG
jgi:glutaredoxin-like protein NrdH